MGIFCFTLTSPWGFFLTWILVGFRCCSSWAAWGTTGIPSLLQCELSGLSRMPWTSTQSRVDFYAWSMSSRPKFPRPTLMQPWKTWMHSFKLGSWILKLSISCSRMCHRPIFMRSHFWGFLQAVQSQINQLKKICQQISIFLGGWLWFLDYYFNWPCSWQNELLLL